MDLAIVNLPASLSRTSVEIFVSGILLHEHANAERCDRFVGRDQRDAYCAAEARGRSLAFIFVRYNKDEHATLTWAEIAAAVKHCAGVRRGL